MELVDSLKELQEGSRNRDGYRNGSDRPKAKDSTLSFTSQSSMVLSSRHLSQSDVRFGSPVGIGNPVNGSLEVEAITSELVDGVNDE